MNKIITSKEGLLEASLRLVAKQGLSSINIRDVAKNSGVSIGTVYNYFSSKADLIASTVEKVWESIINITSRCNYPNSFTECVIWLFDSIKKGSKEYPSFFTLHSMSFAAQDKKR